jgi:hypothetical protein
MTPDTSFRCSRDSPRVTSSANLALTPIERFWLAEDVPGSSLSFFHKYLLDDEVDGQRVFEAIHHVAQRHPLPFSRITKTPNGQYAWQFSPIQSRQLVNSRSPEPYDGTPQIRLEREPGIRLWYNNNAIWFEYHHMCADGRGALQLERDFFDRYADDQQPVVNHRNGPVSDLDCWALLRHRAKARITLSGGFWRSILAWSYLWRALNANVLPFPGATPPGSDHVAMEIYGQRLTKPATTEARRLVKTLRISLNDWILIHVALTIAERTPERTSDHRVIRLVVPIDMRPIHGNVLTCANKMSFVCLDVPQERVDASSSFVRWVSKRMQFLKKHMGLVVWRSIQFGPKQIADLRTYLQHRENMLSCYVSNLGVINGLPDFVQGFEATPTLRRHDTPLALMAYTFRGQLHLTAGYDRARVNQELGRGFVDQLVAKLGVAEREMDVYTEGATYGDVPNLG